MNYATPQKFMKFAILASALFVLSSTASAKSPDDMTINNKTQLEIIDSISYALNHFYIFPEVAKNMEATARKNYKENKYKDITSLAAFTEKLTQDLYDVCKDGHFGIRFRPAEDMPPQEREYSDAEIDEIRKQYQRINFEWEKVERLPGNIGYIKFDAFNHASEAGPTAIAALNFLGYCDAIIFDMRENGGGSPSMIQLIMSYFMEEPTHLNSFYVRETDSLQQFWTQAFVSGPTMYDCDIYVLTSGQTFSAAEEFSYNIRNLERGTLVGETTGGGAHPVSAHFFPNLNVFVRVPYGRAINPISGENWEGVGVKPHIEVPQEEALDVAYLDALKKVKEKTTDEDALYAINWVMDQININISPVVVNEEILRSYVGTYGPRNISFENGSLYYQREGNPKFKMSPMEEDLFWFEEIDYFRIRVEKDKDGKPIALIGLYKDGRTDKSVKN